MTAHAWHSDKALVASLPVRYRMYAAYSRLAGASDSRRVPGGSFALRLLRRLSRMLRLQTVIRIKATPDDTLVADFSDDRILEVLHEVRRENPEYPVMAELLEPGDTFIDVGSNYGTFSLVAARLVGETGRVIALEPQPRLAGFIRESAHLSGITNLMVVESAAGARAGTAFLLIPADDTGRAGMIAGFSATGEHTKLEVSVVTLDDLQHEVGGSALFIKVDVEGSERGVLSGAEKLIARFRPSLMIELNPWSAGAAGSSVDELIAELQGLGYDEFSLAGSFPLTKPIEQIPRDRQENLVARFAGPR